GDRAMGRHRSLHRVGFVLLAVAALVLQAVPAQAGIARGSFHQTNLVSDRDDPRFKTKLVDPDLVNPWGLSSSPTSPIWAADAESSTVSARKGTSWRWADSSATARFRQSLRHSESRPAPALSKSHMRRRTPTRTMGAAGGAMDSWKSSGRTEPWSGDWREA